MPDLYLDIDAHRAYPQVLHAAHRHELDLYVVTHDYLPVDRNIHLILADDRQANAGTWIVENIRRGDICVTGDTGIAASCLARGAVALSPTGRRWTGETAGDDPRSVAGALGGHLAFEPRLFAQRLEREITARGALPPSFAVARGMPRGSAGPASLRAPVPA